MLLSLRMVSSFYSVKDINRGKDKTARTREQGSSGLEGGRHLCTGEDMSSEVQRTS